jgi:hypothetical protein
MVVASETDSSNVGVSTEKHAAYVKAKSTFIRALRFFGNSGLLERKCLTQTFSLRVKRFWWSKEPNVVKCTLGPNRPIMANPEYVKRLTQSVDAWNDWRKRNPEVRPNLSESNLSSADLSGADLSRADLSGADLSEADLIRANFHTARLGYTTFAGVDLCAVEELDAVIHEGPSTVNVNTVKLPEGKTRMLFLRGTGFSDTFIDYLPALLTAVIQYESCFISYAHQDEALAQRLVIYQIKKTVFQIVG